MRLFMIQIGFKLEGMNTGHDTLFAIAETQEEAFAQVKKARPYAHHVDTCLEVHSAGSYEVQILADPPSQEEKLWFVNLGGYREGEFGERHKCLLVVAPTLEAAKAQAKQDPFFKEGLSDPQALTHIDDKYALGDGIDDLLCLSNSMQGIALVPVAEPTESRLTIRYTPL